jgi:hypothetical protein
MPRSQSSDSHYEICSTNRNLIWYYYCHCLFIHRINALQDVHNWGRGLSL